MKSTLIALSLCIIFFFEGTSQQLKWGPTMSLGVSDIVTPLGNNVEAALLTAFSIGVSTQHALTKHLDLRTGLRYTAKGTKKDLVHWDGFVERTIGSYRYKTSYAEIPLTLNLDFGKKYGFIVSGGVYYGVALSGKEKYKRRGQPPVDRSIEFTSTYDPTNDQLQLRPSDFGGIITIGHSWEKVILDLGWNGSLSSVHPIENDDWRHNFLKFNVTYFIKG